MYEVQCRAVYHSIEEDDDGKWFVTKRSEPLFRLLLKLKLCLFIMKDPVVLSEYTAALSGGQHGMGA